MSRGPRQLCHLPGQQHSIFKSLLHLHIPSALYDWQIFICHPLKGPLWFHSEPTWIIHHHLPSQDPSASPICHIPFATQGNSHRLQGWWWDIFGGHSWPPQQSTFTSESQPLQTISWSPSQTTACFLRCLQDSFLKPLLSLHNTPTSTLTLRLMKLLGKNYRMGSYDSFILSDSSGAFPPTLKS